MTTMYDPVHPGESLRDVMDAKKWTVTEAAAKLGCTRQTFSRLLNGRTGISASDGAGVGTHRVEQRRLLGAAAGAVRTRTRTFAPEEIGRMTRRTSKYAGRWRAREVGAEASQLVLILL